MTMRKAAAAIALVFAAAALTGCKDDKNQQAATQNTARESRIDSRFHMTYDDIAVRTATGRELRLNVSAYCNKEIKKHPKADDAYREACRAAIGQKLMYSAKHEDSMSRFEAFPPMGSTEIRPYNVFTVEMMLRAADRLPDYDIYTVTDVHDCHTGERTPLMDPYRPAPPGGWPSEEERKKSQTSKPVPGRVVDGICKLPAP